MKQWNGKHSNKTNNKFICCNGGIFSKNVVALKRAGVTLRGLHLLLLEVPQDSRQPGCGHPRRWAAVSHRENDWRGWWHQGPRNRENGWRGRWWWRHGVRHGENRFPVLMYPPPPDGTDLRRSRAWRCCGLLLLSPPDTLDIKGAICPTDNS